MHALLDGKALAEKINTLNAHKVKALAAQSIVPGLAVVLIGDDPASQVYVGAKVRQCKALGIFSQKIVFPKNTSQEEVLECLEQLNRDDRIHGILVQSPPPAHINEEALVAAIAPHKDVDGFHPINVAKLVSEDSTGFLPCTPAGCMELLKEASIPLEGAEVVVIGRSMIVGKPMALLLMGKKANATVTLAHSRTRNLAEVCKRADIIIAAVGRPHFVNKEMVKEGATVIDVGINRIDDAHSPRGYRLVGDVDYEKVAPLCRAITPVPGGVGPMTIAMLMSNTILAAQRLLKKEG